MGQIGVERVKRYNFVLVFGFYATCIFCASASKWNMRPRARLINVQTKMSTRRIDRRKRLTTQRQHIGQLERTSSKKKDSPETAHRPAWSCV